MIEREGNVKNVNLSYTIEWDGKSVTEHNDYLKALNVFTYPITHIDVQFPIRKEKKKKTKIYKRAVVPNNNVRKCSLW